jgi:hypothetical protein
MPGAGKLKLKACTPETLTLITVLMFIITPVEEHVSCGGTFADVECCTNTGPTLSMTQLYWT